MTRAPRELLQLARDDIDALCNDSPMAQFSGSSELRATAAGDSDQELLDAFITAGRALVALAARSLGEIGHDVTLAQYRTLVVLRTRGPQRTVDLSGALAVDPSTASRMVERLVRKRLAARDRSQSDRRTVRTRLTPAGNEVVAHVTERRQAEIGRMLELMPSTDRQPLTTALRAFAAAVGEPPEQDWSSVWDQ